MLLSELSSQYQTSKSKRLYNLYDQLLEGWKMKPVTLLELGIDRGGSLQVWRDFFPEGVIIGLDGAEVSINDDSGRIHQYTGLQQDTAILDRIAMEHARSGFDIVIDDCGHIAKDARASFWHLFPRYVRPGGLYIIEDWSTGYWETWPDGKKYDGSNHLAGMVGFIKELVDECEAWTIIGEKGGEPPHRSSYIESLKIFPGLVVAERSKELVL